jgi:hypothetical protein
MNLLVLEILLAVAALKRGWRVAPLLLVALPVAARFAEPALAELLAPWVGDYFEPAATARALAHSAALLGLVGTAWTGPSELRVRGGLARPARRTAGSLYQI